MRLGHLLAGLGILALTPATALSAWAPQSWISPRGSSGYTSAVVVVSSDDRALAGWIRTPPGGSASTGRVELAWRRGPGARWTRPRPLSGAGASTLRVSLNGRGDAVAAWVRGRTLVAAVRMGPAGRWSAARLVGAGGPVDDLQLAIDARGRPTAIWSERRGDGFLVRLSSRVSPRAGWSVRPAQLATSGPAPPALALSPAGALVGWSDRGRTRVSRTVGGVFEPPDEVSSENSTPPGVALSPGGAGLAAWGVTLPGGTSIVLGAGRATAAREWGAPEDLGIGQAPRVALNDRGDALVAWGLGGSGAAQGIEATTRRRGEAWRATTVVRRRDCRCVLRVVRAAIDGSGAPLVAWWRENDTGLGRGGAAAVGPGASAWTYADVGPGLAREAPSVAAAPGAGGLAIWVEAGARGGVRAAAFRP
jgi:hypothetical protein